MATSLPPVPAAFKPIQHYIKTAIEHDKRDPVVAYYCRLYALQRAMEIDKKSPDSRQFLVGLMDLLETTKNANAENEAIQNEVVGQAHVEHSALQLFLYADNEDRASRFGKNVVKSFYTAGMLFDVLSTFGELSEDILKNRKYAKWKAAYIHNCLKNGETPQPGPLGGEDDEFGDFGEDMGGATGGLGLPPGATGGLPNPYQPPSQHTIPSPSYPQPHAPPTTPADFPAGGAVPQHNPRPAAPAAPPAASWQAPANTDGVNLGPQDYQKAMKFCKYAGSALQYEDPKTAIENLTKALKLLTTGNEN